MESTANQHLGGALWGVTSPKFYIHAWETLHSLRNRWGFQLGCSLLSESEPEFKLCYSRGLWMVCCSASSEGMGAYGFLASNHMVWSGRAKFSMLVFKHRLDLDICPLPLLESKVQTDMGQSSQMSWNETYHLDLVSLVMKDSPVLPEQCKNLWF